MSGKRYLMAVTFRSEHCHSSFTYTHPLPLKRWGDDDWIELLQEGQKQAGEKAVPVFIQQLGKEKNEKVRRTIFRRNAKRLQ